LMEKRYLGDFISRKLNYGNWLNWTYVATIGFPIQFVISYFRWFIRNLTAKKHNARNFLHSGVRMHTIFTVPLVNAWRDIKRRWRNLLVKTYAGVTVKRWSKEYRASDYNQKLQELFIGKKRPHTNHLFKLNN
jgi:hypothetical protein